MASANFSVSDPQTEKRVVNALNTSFDSIKNIVNEYKPVTTVQDYGLISYYGEIKEGKNIYVSRKSEAAIPVFAQSYGVYEYVGTLEGNTISFVKTLEDKATIYQPYRIAIVKDRTGILAGGHTYYDDINR
jgi:hypothetical protein